MAPVEGIPDVITSSEAIPKAAPEVTDKVVTQIKHYFSDASLNHDEFLCKGIAKDDGWVSFEVLARFNRLRQLMGLPDTSRAGKGNKKSQAVPVKDVIAQLSTIVKEGIKEDDPLEIKEDNTAIRRKEAYTPSDEWFSNTVHVKGLPYGKEWSGMIDKLTEFFNKKGEVVLLRLRRNPKSKAFKGNLLVEYATKDQAEATAKDDELVFEENKLETTMLPAYHDEKLAADEFIQPELRKPGASYPTFEEWCVAHGREPPAPLQNDKTKNKPAEKEPEFEVVPGVLVQFTGVNDDISIPQLKEAFGALGDVKFVEHEKDEENGIVRFKEPVPKDFAEKNPELKIGDAVLKLKLVEGEEEKAFFERARQASVNARANKRTSHHNGGNRNKRYRK
ncbi:hypothetical protein COEREDRAFT_80382 [Coemansia reversa NRRL 1564]|uniref:La-domain-containing protein n=1 Tax=Coemansia reversa (strain ATCC 12441 / NRRL 1564) TaxID=763665 RepID=A0A2G5BG77_COERN|nr:hypothetical protein COEREDRAFT_80382 [Coemansia reversa NRRL 1564]|eukprot:PIA17707.1 hypothetical protein COEREDRAFT_80382 [Coemansia reversa NRRL 1564]